MTSLSSIAIICAGLWSQWHLSISDIFKACVCNLDPPILSNFPSLSSFSKAVGLFWLDVRARMTSFGKKSSEHRFRGKWRRWKLWRKLSREFTGHLLNVGMNNLFSFTDTWTKENKTVNGLQKETLESLICADLSATHWIFLWSFYAISIFKTFLC